MVTLFKPRSTSYLEQKKQLTQWKKTNLWLKDVRSQVTQDCVKRLHNTWERFKSKKFGFPRYKDTPADDAPITDTALHKASATRS